MARGPPCSYLLCCHKSVSCALHGLIGLSDVTDSDSTTHSLFTSTFTSTGVVSDSQSIVPTVVGSLCGAFLLSVVLLLMIVVVASYFNRQRKFRDSEKGN